MKESEVKPMRERLMKFSNLEELRTKVRAAIVKVTEDDPSGPCGQGPFTGNTRESRQVQSMTIRFTPTRGGAPAVEIDIRDMLIEAHELGNELRVMLNSRLQTITDEIEKL